MAEKGVIFDRASAERIARVVKAYEREPVNLVGPRKPFRERIHPYVTFRVKLVQSGGSNGSSTVAPTYTYHAYRPNDTSNERKLNTASSGAAVSPEKTSPVGLVTAATIGLAYYDNTGAFTLYEAYEKPGTLLGCT